MACLIFISTHLPRCYSVFPLVHPVYFQLSASSQPLHLPPLLPVPAGDTPPWLAPKISSVLGRFHDRMAVSTPVEFPPSSPVISTCTVMLLTWLSPECVFGCFSFWATKVASPHGHLISLIINISHSFTAQLCLSSINWSIFMLWVQGLFYFIALTYCWRFIHEQKYIQSVYNDSFFLAHISDADKSGVVLT